MNKRLIGLKYENMATAFLITKGYFLIKRNFQCRLGEIDLIFQHNENIVFVEVRFRKNIDFGGGPASVDYRKQTKIGRCAKYFLATNPRFSNYPCRFDVITITLVNGEPQIDWIKNAFGIQ